jgi:hypothetical protein
MSSNGYPPGPPQVEIDPQMQAMFENILNQRLYEQEQQFHVEVQKREEEVRANDMALRAALESVSSQLEAAKLQSRRVANSIHVLLLIT